MLVQGGTRCTLCLKGFSIWQLLYMLFCMTTHVLGQLTVESFNFQMLPGHWLVVTCLYLNQWWMLWRSYPPESYPSISWIKPMVVSLIKNYLVCKEAGSQVIETVKCKVIVRLRSRFKMLDNPIFAQSAIAVSILLGPTHKNLAVIEDPEVKEQIKAFILDCI